MIDRNFLATRQMNISCSRDAIKEFKEIDEMVLRTQSMLKWMGAAALNFDNGRGHNEDEFSLCGGDLMFILDQLFDNQTCVANYFDELRMAIYPDCR